MIKSIKLANSCSVEQAGYIAKDLSNLYNLNMDVEFSVLILNSFFEEFIENNTIKNKLQSLLNNLNSNSDLRLIEEVSESIRETIANCEFTDELKEYVNDAYETLPWQKTQSAKDLLNEPRHKVDIIASPNYVTIPIIISNVEKELILEKIKEVYIHFFSKEEIIYRLNSEIDEKFSISLILQKYQDYNASAFCYPDKNLGILKLYVFPGCINIKDMIKPDNEVRPDYYEIIRDTLKLKTSIAGKQKFKNTCSNGKYKRQECNITNFIIDDYAASELARITKKAGILLEKEVQIIFNISKDKLIIEHVSNVLDLQKGYYSKTKELITKSNTIEELPTNSFVEDVENADENEEVKDFQEQEEIEKENDLAENNEEIEQNIQETNEDYKESKYSDDILSSDKPLSELMKEQPEQETEQNQEIELEEKEEYIEEQKDENSNDELDEPEKEKINNNSEDLTEEIEDSQEEHSEENIETKEQDNNNILNAEPIDILNDSEKEQKRNNFEKDSEDLEQNIPKQEDKDNLQEVKKQELKDDKDDFEESIDEDDEDNLKETEEQDPEESHDNTEEDEEVDLEEPKKDDDFIL